MKTKLTIKDIYDIKIEDVTLGDEVGCPRGYENFTVNVDDICSNDSVKLDISGACVSFGRHNPFDCSFDGTIECKDFSQEYAAAEDYNRKYVQFVGSINVRQGFDQISIDDSYICEDFVETLNRIESEYADFVFDPSIITDALVQRVVLNASDEIAKFIEEHDGIEVDTYSLYEYLVDTGIMSYSYEIEDDEYSQLNRILFDELIRSIKNNDISDEIDSALTDVSTESEEKIEITAKVFLADLDL